jgi:peptidoglycan-associated lipoprotein
MRAFVSVFAVVVVGLALVLCPGCKKRQTVLPPAEEELLGPGGGFELVLPGEAPPRSEFQEPENKEVYQDIHFDFDSDVIRAVDRPILNGVAEDLKANPGMFLLIEGHCDERGTNEYNLALGERRALGTREFLAGLGVEAGRMVTVSYGEEDAIDPGHTEEAWARNRRAHFKVAVKAAEAAE